LIGDGHAMGVTAQVAEHVLWTSEGSLGIDHPALSEQGPQPRREGLRLGEGLEVSVENQLAIAEGALESGNKLAAKDATEHRNGKKEREV